MPHSVRPTAKQIIQESQIAFFAPMHLSQFSINRGRSVRTCLPIKFTRARSRTSNQHFPSTFVI